MRDFLEKESINFIKDYAKAVNTPTFSYADLWEIKQGYLFRLQEIADSLSETTNTVFVSTKNPEQKNHF